MLQLAMYSRCTLHTHRLVYWWHYHLICHWNQLNDIKIIQSDVELLLPLLTARVLPVCSFVVVRHSYSTWNTFQLSCNLLIISRVSLLVAGCSKLQQRVTISVCLLSKVNVKQNQNNSLCTCIMHVLARENNES